MAFSSFPNRPLSPHLQVYRPQLTSVLSILHRASGIILGAGSIPLVLWLGSIACGSEAYQSVICWYTGITGKILIAGWIFCYYYHLANGIRHLFWDAGFGYSLKSVYGSGWLVVAVACMLALFTICQIFA